MNIADIALWMMAGGLTLHAGISVHRLFTEGVQARKLYAVVKKLVLAENTERAWKLLAVDEGRPVADAMRFMVGRARRPYSLLWTYHAGVALLKPVA